MRKLFLAAVLMLCALPLAALAQDAPRTEIFGGYSYLRAGDDALDDGVDLHGWNASINQSVNRWFGIKADFSGHYGDITVVPGYKADLNAHLFLAGAQFTLRKHEVVQPFAHLMVGAARLGVSGRVLGTRYSESDSAFAMAVGGGVDVKLHRRLAVRLFQADYVLTTFDGGPGDDDVQHNLRVSTGLVLRLGSQ